MIPSSGVRRFASPRNLPLATHARVVSGRGVVAQRGPVAPVPGVQQAAQVFAALGVLPAEDRVCLFQQERGRHVGADRPVHRRRGRSR